MELFPGDRTRAWLATLSVGLDPAKIVRAHPAAEVEQRQWLIFFS
jgi:hypothetical protein